jgi:hypothetical protein
VNNILLPYRWKLLGISLTVIGMVLAIVFFSLDFRLKIPVFAVYSSFLEAKMFVTFQTNFADEIIMILLLCGLGLIIFSKEKTEYEGYDLIRLKALAKAVLVNICFLLFAVLFIYGSGFIAILVINIFSLFLLYLLFFYKAKITNK